jgi:tetratricopeptide (TPR) repeat protein
MNRHQTTAATHTKKNSARSANTPELTLAQQISAWCDRTIITSIYAVALLTPFIFTWINSELFEFNKMLFVYAIAIILVGASAVKMIIHKKWLIQNTVFNIPIGLFVGSSVLSTVFSIHPYTSFWGYYSRFNGGLASVLAYTAIFYVAVSTLERKHLPALLITLVISLFGSTLYAFPEHFGYSPSCTLIRGEFNAACWKQDVQHRVFGTFGQPNWLAAYIVLLLPLALVLPVATKKVPIQVLATTTLLLSYPTLLFTKSRSGFLGFAIGMLIFAVGLLFIFFKLFKSKLPNQKNVRKLVYVAAACGFLLFTSLLFGTPYSPSWSHIMQNFQNEQIVDDINETPKESVEQETQPVNRLEVGGTDSGEIRMIVWKGAIDVWRRYPLLGSGLETFAYSYYLDRPVAHNHVSEWDFLYNKAHNEFLNLLATTGIVGVFSYVSLLSWFCITTIVVTTKRIRSTAVASFQSTQAVQDSFILVALLAGMIALSISNFLGFATVAVTVVMYLFFVITQILFAQEKENNQLEPKEIVTLTIWQKIGIGLAILATLLLLLSIRNRWQADWYYNEGLQAARQSYVQDSVSLFIKAIQLQPREAVFYDDLANSYSKIAFVLAEQEIQKKEALEKNKANEENMENEKNKINEENKKNEVSKENKESEGSLYQQLEPQTKRFIQMAVSLSDTALTLNAAHLNFYKTRIKIMLLFSELDKIFLDEAERTTQLAMRLSPTDPKLVLTMAKIKLIQGDTPAATELLEKSVSLKPNYEPARMALAELYLETKNYTDALEQYLYVLTHISPENEPALQAVEKLEKLTQELN